MTQADEAMEGLKGSGYENYAEFEKRAHEMGVYSLLSEHHGQVYYDFRFQDGSRITWRGNPKTGHYSAS